MFDWEEYKRWIDQARYTLSSMEADIEHGSYSWACFKAHQVAEYSLKAFLRGAGLPAFGHDLRDLYEKFNSYCEVDMREEILELSKYYIPTRYPDAFPGGSPYQFYTLEEAKRSLAYAKRVIEEVEECAERIKKALK